MDGTRNKHGLRGYNKTNKINHQDTKKTPFFSLCLGALVVNPSVLLSPLKATLVFQGLELVRLTVNPFGVWIPPTWPSAHPCFVSVPSVAN